MRKRSAFLAVCLCLVAYHAHADSCVDWGRAMTRFDVANTPTWKKVVVIEPFDNFTRMSPDDWLATGVPYMLAEYMNVITKDVSTLYGPLATYFPGYSAPAYKVNGMYQHLDGKLRIFAKLWQGADLLKQFQIDLPYPQNKQFFDQLGEIALGILQFVSPSYDKNKFEAIQVETPSVPAFENFIRGKIAYYGFDPAQMEIAKTWFEESKKADLYYSKAYLGLIDVYTFLAMYNKQNRKPFSSYFEKASSEINLMNKFSKRPLPPELPRKYMLKIKDRPLQLTNRFLIGNSFFIAGLDAAGQKNYAEAARQFELSLSQVPEDAITWHHLGQMYQQAGDQGKANDAFAKAKEMNRCLN